MSGIHRGPVNSPHKWPVTRKMFPFDDVIMSQTGAKCHAVPSTEHYPNRGMVNGIDLDPTDEFLQCVSFTQKKNKL